MSTLAAAQSAHAQDGRLERRIQSVQELLADDLMWVEGALAGAVADGPAPGTDAAGMQFERAVAQVLALLAPYLRGAHRALAEHLGARYLEMDDARADPPTAGGS